MPVANEVSSPDPAPPSASARQDRARVLLVDDDRLARYSTALSLRERGFVVDDCDDGSVALQRLMAMAPDELPDVLVVDAMMPGIDGFETCRRLRATPRLAGLPVLMLTALDDEESVREAFDAGANDFFTKSLRWTLLEARLRFLLRASHLQRDLSASRLRLERAQRIAGMGSFEWDGTRRLLLDVHGCQRLLGLPDDCGPLRWQALRDMVHPDDREALSRRCLRALRRGAMLQADFRVRLPDGSLRALCAWGEIERGRRTALRLHGVLQDVTVQRQAQARIDRLSNYDALTGLPNRRLFRSRFAQALQAGGPGMLGALAIDIDRFKDVNDSLGQAAGDDLLCETARRLRAALRDLQPADPAGAHVWPEVSRLGGNEFAVLLPALTDPAHAMRIAERLLDALREPLRLNGEEVFPSASIGLALHPRDGRDVDALLARADVAMRQVKARGGMGVFDGSGAGAASARLRLELERRLARAIARGELELHYQPQLGLACGSVVGVEALMRWNVDGRTLLPAEFMSLAEETGLIVPMGEWAIREACAQWRRWQDALVSVPHVAVNLASQHFERESLIETMQASLAEHGVPAGVLEIEITETGVMRDLARALPQLQALKGSGVGLAIDDFGTGHSSLAYLTRLPLEVLKIDRSFVQDLDAGTQGVAVVTAIVALARTLSLRVIAEGVETEAQCRHLAGLGCFATQGWLHAPAMPAADFETWYRSREGAHA